MPIHRRTTCFPRLLFFVALAIATALFALVLLAPLLDNAESMPQGAARLPAVFARDRMLRRTAIAAALGLLATACIFFRSGRDSRFGGRRHKPPRTPPPPSIAGA